MMLSVFNGRHGFFVHDEEDQVIGRSLQLYGEWAEEEIYLLSKVVRSGDVVLDIGANVGTHSVAFSRMVGDVGHVIAVDGQARASSLLSFNLTVNKCDNVFRLEGLVSNKCQVIFDSFKLPTNPNIGSVSFRDIEQRDAAQSDRIAMRPLVMFSIDSLKVPKCKLIKIDIEGMELEALQGAAETLQRCRPYIYFEQASELNFREICEFLTNSNYKLFSHLANPFNINNINKCPHNIFGGARELNIFAVPDEVVFDIPHDVAIKPVTSFDFDFEPALAPEGWPLPPDAYQHLPAKLPSLAVSIPSELAREGALGHHYRNLTAQFQNLQNDRTIAQEIMEDQLRQIQALTAQLPPTA